MKRMVGGICAAVVLVLVLAGSAMADKIGILWNGSYLLDPYSTITGLIGDGNETMVNRLAEAVKASSSSPVAGTTIANGDGNFTVDSSGNVLMRTASYLRDAENPFCQQFYSGTNYDDNYTEFCAPETGYSETYRLYWPAAAPTGNQVMVFPVPTLGKSQGTWQDLSGGGDLVSTNNLSDLGNATEAVGNLSDTLYSLVGLTETAGGIPYGTADNTYAWLAAGATTEILVGGGAAAPVWTTATGTGAPVRAGSPTFTGAATSPTYVNSGAVSVSPFSAAGAIYRAVASTITDNFTPGTRAVGAAYSFGIPTFASDGNSITVTDAVSLYIAGPPVDGGDNMELTNVWALYVALGNAYIKGALYAGNSGFIVDDDGDVTAKSYTTTKVSNTATQILLYGDNGTQTLGAGWMGPHDTTARTANYYVRMPTEEPTDGQVIAAGTPSEHIAGATWVTPIRAGVTEITKYQYLPAAWFEDNATSPPAAAAVISGEETKARLFADNETSIVLWQVDPEWSAGLKFRVYYSLVANGEANDTAIFRLKGCTVGNSEALTCTAGDPIGVTDELGTDDDANELMITDWSDAVTLTGIAANELARLTFYRGSDDEAGELNVIGIELKYKAKVSAASDY